MYPVDGLQENKDLLQKMLSGIHLEGRKGIARYWQCESNSIRSGKKMPHVQDSLSLQDGCIANIHRPTQGWTVREDILTLQSMLASSTVQPWVGRSRTTPFPMRRHTGSARGAFLSLLANWFPLYNSIQVTISRKDVGEPSLGWLLPSQESSTSWVKKCLRLWLTNLMDWPLYADHVDVKR